MSEQSQPLPPPPDRPLPVWVYPLVTVFVWAAGIVLLLHFFGAFKFIFLTALAAGALASTLKPVRDGLAGPRWLAGAIAGLIPILVVAGILYLVGWLIAGPIADEAKQWPAMKESLNGLLAGWSRWLHLDYILTVDDLLGQARNYFLGPAGAEVATTTASVVSTVAIALITIFIGSLYMQIEPTLRLLSPVLAMLPPDRRAPMQHAFEDLIPQLRWWLIGTLIDILAVGLLTWLIFWWGGVPLAIPLAVLAGLSEIVPNIGPPIAFAIALLFAAAQGTGTVLVVVIAFVAIHVVESYILLPLVMKRAIQVSPVITIFTVIFWSEIFGVAGLLLALPINLLIWSFLDHFARRRFERPAGFRSMTIRTLWRPQPFSSVSIRVHPWHLLSCCGCHP